MAFKLELAKVMSEDDNASEASTVLPVPHRSPAVELHATYTSLEVLVALVAVVGNAMVIYVFHRDRRLRRRTNYYIVSLAVADFLVGLLGIPFAILASVGLPRNLHACLFTVSLLVMLCTISIFCLVAVSVDRYWAILHPMCYSRNVRTKTAIGFSIVAVSVLASFIKFAMGWAPGRRRPVCGAPEPGERRRRARQSRAGARPHCTMRLHALFVYIFVNILFVRAKIHGGPRGRFDKPLPTKPAYNHHVSAHHTHYSYHPPTHINFICRHCTSVTSYPVFHGLPPTYVYKYRESGNRYGDLLTGLALYNLGRVSSHWHDAHYYAPRRDEKCSLQVIDRAHFEETVFPCFMMSSFMKEKVAVGDGPESFDITSAQVNVKPFIQTTGSPVEVTREQMCVVWRNATAGKERTAIPCALLKEYSNTMKPSGVPVYVWLPITLATVVAISVCCQCLCRKKEVSKEQAPINNTIVGYSYQ